MRSGASSTDGNTQRLRNKCVSVTRRPKLIVLDEPHWHEPMTEKQQNLFESDPTPWELDDEAERSIATVVLAAAPFGPFDYLAPPELLGKIEPGRRVRVPLGRGNRTLEAYCVGLRNESTEASRARSYRLKPVRSVVDDQALASPRMLALTEWMAKYYLCPWGQVLEAVIPAGVRGQAGTREVVLLHVPTSVTARLTQLKLPPKQAHALKCLAGSTKPISIADLGKLAGCTAAPIRQLMRKGLVNSQTVRLQQGDHDVAPLQSAAPPQLNADQQRALDEILEVLRAQSNDTILVHGVTGSGKTEVYMRAIEEVISFGRQAIVLVPEISLTPQTVARFRARFDRIAVLHSHLSPTQRHWHWRSIARGEIQVVVGARSAVFAPTPHLGLIVLDEEHDASFKQDSVPRYHARCVARQRAELENIPVVLGSATPSLESWHNAQTGSFRLVELASRVLDRPLPNVAVIDLRTEFQNRGSRGAISRPLQMAMKQALEQQGQVILLLNRRGFSTSIQCNACGHVVRCNECDIALTHHREGEKAVCHYCDYQIIAPTNCPECNFEGIRYAGLGTQRLEAEVRSRFPNYQCLRMDSDTMQRHGSHEEAFARFRAGEVQILVGTQMIAKGLDFPDVTLVGVINADTALHFPDFRAAERTFQLVTQVAGRTGRGERGGRVLVQTFSPDHPAIVAAMQHDYHRFAAVEIPIRQEHGYPPFCHMARIILRAESETITEQFGEQIADRLRAESERREANVRVLGPAPAPLSKLRGRFRFHLLLLCAQPRALHDTVQAAINDLKTPDEVQWVVDVDPSDML